MSRRALVAALHALDRAPWPFTDRRRLRVEAALLRALRRVPAQSVMRLRVRAAFG